MVTRATQSPGRAQSNSTAVPEATQRRVRPWARTSSVGAARTGLGGAAGYAQLSRPDGQILRSEEKGVVIPITAATRAVAAGKRGAFFSDATIAGTPVRVLAERGRGGRRLAGRAAADRRGQHAHAPEARARDRVPRRDRARGRARAARLARRAGAGAPPDGRHRTRRAHAGPRPPHRGRRGGRARAAGRELQHDAGRARALAPGPAPARLRRLARAAHAADQRAGEPRRARARRAAAPARARPRDRGRTGAAAAS